MNPYRDTESSLNYSDIAAKLLQDNYLLTALELHTELVENGKELPQLREFFSNPGNFEQHVAHTDSGPMERCESQATLDSLDMARYSEDGAGSGGDVAVLEFELRKARETINSLRANLTQFADHDSNVLKKSEMINDESINILKPHEKRALNFLINEYLLINNYKLTSITFSDENPDQDFDDWDEVGLNMPRPRSMVSLYRGEAVSKPETEEASAQCDLTIEIENNVNDETVICVSCQTSYETGAEEWNNEIMMQAEEIVMLKEKIHQLETDKLNYEHLYDEAVATLNSLATTPVCDLELNIPQDKLQKAIESGSQEILAVIDDVSATKISMSLEKLDELHRNYFGGSKAISTSGSLYRQTRTGADESCGVSVNTLDNNISVEYLDVVGEHYIDINEQTWINSDLPDELKSMILSCCCKLNKDGTSNSNGSDIMNTIINMKDNLTPQHFLAICADVIPNMLNECSDSWLRATCIALLSCCATLLTSDVRNKIVHTLVELGRYKEHLSLIASGLTLVMQAGGGPYILSCITDVLTTRELSTHNSAASLTLQISPHIPIQLLTSLTLSLTQVILAHHHTEVQCHGVKLLALIASVAHDKYDNIEEMVFNLMNAGFREELSSDVFGLLWPIVGRTALLTGNLSALLQKLIDKTTNELSSNNTNKAITYINILKSLMNCMIVYTINVQCVRECFTESSSTNVERLNDTCLVEVRHYCDDFYLLYNSANMLFKSKPDIRWCELTTIEEVVLKPLMKILTSGCVLTNETLYLSFISYFHKLCGVFGQTLTSLYIKQMFAREIIEMEKLIEKLQLVNKGSAATAGVYLAGVLPAIENREVHISSFLSRWLVCSAVCGLPASVLYIPLTYLINEDVEVAGICFTCIHEVATDSRHGRSGESIRQLTCQILNRVCVDDGITEQFVNQYILPTSMYLAEDDDAKLESMDSPQSAVSTPTQSTPIQTPTHAVSRVTQVLQQAKPNINNITNIFKRKS